MMRLVSSTSRLAAIGGWAMLCAGCALPQDARIESTEQMLAAAGFHMRPVDTADKQTQLAAVPQHKLVARPPEAASGDALRYAYADADRCHCIYLGDEKAYQAYQRLAFQKRLADEQLTAAQLNEDETLDWNAWGPGPWGPGPWGPGLWGPGWIR
jgi:hypothetical protein